MGINTSHTIRRLKECCRKILINPAGKNLEGMLSVIGGGSCGVKQSEINVIGRNTYNLLHFSKKK